jgi:hypothetical protein
MFQKPHLKSKKEASEYNLIPYISNAPHNVTSTHKQYEKLLLWYFAFFV